MTIELPTLHLGLAGFTAQQQDLIRAMLETMPHRAVTWALAPLAEADAWWVNGARTQVNADGTLRINPGTPTARALHLELQDVDRPIGFALPLPAGRLEAACTFSLTRPDETLQALDRFTAWLRPMLAQFGLASAILDNQAALGGGTFQLFNGTTLVAVVDMRGDVGVVPTATVADFQDTIWRRVPTGGAGVPDHFAKMSLSQLMWHFAMRTKRDLLPAHYRTGLLYFRRAPRLPQRLLQDTHLLLLRELSVGCATMEELHVRSGMSIPALSRTLAALYIVGAITSNPKRAGKGATRRLETGDSHFTGSPSSLHPDSRTHEPPPPGDLTAPAQLRH